MRAKRRWIGGVLGLAGVAGGVLLAREPIAVYAATRALRAAGFPEATVVVRRLDLAGFDASLGLGPAGKAESLVLGWSAAGLMAGRLDRAALRGVDLRLRLADGGALEIPGWSPATGGGAPAPAGTSPLPTIPVDELTIEDAAVTLETGAGSLSQPFRLTGSGSGSAFDARLDLPAAEQELAALTPLTGPAAGRLSLAGAVTLRLDGDAVRAAPDGCLTLMAKGLAVAGQGIALPDGLCLRAAAEGEPVAVWTPGGAEPLAVRALAAVPRLSVPTAAVEATDVALTLTGGGRRIDMTASARLRHTATPAAVAPLAVTAKASWSDAQPVTFSATGSGGPLRVTAEGTHDAATGKGRVDLRLPRMAFGPDGTALAKAFPALAGTVTATAGGVAAKGRIAWGQGAPTSSGEVLLDGVAAALGPVSVAGVNGTVRLSSLLPPVAPAGQTLAVSLLDVGIPLTDGTLRFGYGRDGRVAVERAEWRWAGGVLRAKPFTLSPQAPQGLVELEAEGIDFAQLLSLAAVDGLDATGRLRGQLPVRIDGGTVRIDDGVLEAAAPGAVRYDPAEPPSFLAGDPGSATDLLRGALTDFRYQELRLTVNGTAGGELVVGLSLQGANPDFYDGHPVKLNLNLSGALDRILRQSIDAYRIPDAVRDSMTEFGLKPP